MSRITVIHIFRYTDIIISPIQYILGTKSSGPDHIGGHIFKIYLLIYTNDISLWSIIHSGQFNTKFEAFSFFSVMSVSDKDIRGTKPKVAKLSYTIEKPQFFIDWLKHLFWRWIWFFLFKNVKQWLNLWMQVNFDKKIFFWLCLIWYLIRKIRKIWACWEFNTTRHIVYWTDFIKQWCKWSTIS